MLSVADTTLGQLFMRHMAIRPLAAFLVRSLSADLPR